MIGTKRFFWILLMVSLAGCVDKSRDLIPSLLANDDNSSNSEETNDGVNDDSTSTLKMML